MERDDDKILTDEQIDSLSTDQRLRLIERLRDGLDSSASFADLDEATLDELEREMEAHERDPSSSRPWTEVERRTRAVLAGRDEEFVAEATIDDGGDDELSNAWKAELDRRLAAHSRDPAAGRPADEVLAEMDRDCA